MAKFNFSEYGRVYCPIYIKPMDDTTLSSVRFKVDTGADNTTISKEVLIELGYGIDWINQNAIVYKDADKPITASGDRINAGYIQFTPYKHPWL